MYEFSRKIGIISHMNFPTTLNVFFKLIFKTFPVWLISLFVISVLYRSATNISWPFVNKWIVEMFESATTGVFSWVFWAVVGMFAATLIFGILEKILTGWFLPYLSKYINQTLYEYIYQNDTDFFINQPAGQTSSYVAKICGNFISLTISTAIQITGFVLSLVFVLGTILTMDVYLALIIFVIVAVRGAWQLWMQRKINKQKKIQVEKQSRVSGYRIDSLTNVLNIKMFGNTADENKFIWKKQMDLLKTDRQIFKLDLLRSIPSNFIWLVMQIFIILFAVFMIFDGQITISDGVFVVTGARSFGSQLSSVFLLIQSYSETKTEATKAYNSVIVPQTIADKPNAKRLVKQKSEIVFDNVSFTYKNGKKVLKNFNLTVAPNEKLGIVGLSGSGKTTLINLLLRMYDVDTGAIKINGTDIRDLIQNSLHKNISVVPQDVTLFNRTILENIRYGAPNASKSDVIRAAKHAYIHDFIMGLPNGYDTLVGNRGVKLSGGQRQRVAIARAILKDAPILVFDEATSALDSESEKYIQNALNRIMHGKTAIVIAHRLSTLRNMTRIVVIQNGKIVETGTHKQLLRANGAYRKLWNMQTDGFVG